MAAKSERTIGTIADAQAAATGTPGRAFSFKLDGLVAPRKASESLLESATVVELVEVTEALGANSEG